MEYIVLNPPKDNYKDFMAMENNLYKNILFHKTIKHETFFEVNLCKKEGKTYFSSQSFKVKQSKESYYRYITRKDGFTIDEKGKVNVWFGKNIFEILMLDTFLNQYLNTNWLDNSLRSYITKGIFEKIVAGKITNNTDLCKAYLKAMRLNCSPRLFHEATHTLSKMALLRMCGVAKDINHMLEYVVNTQKEGTTINHIINDMIDQAMMLRKKIDFKWSAARLNEEHNNWTREIMGYEMERMVDEPIPDVHKWLAFDTDEIKLLKTKKEVFTEGRVMNHCIYTNYWNTITYGHYLAFHIIYDGREATLGVNNNNGYLVFNQCYSHHNGAVTPAIKDLVNSFIDNINTKHGYEKREELPF